ncbi:Copia protein [Durusdinium trenchii]|uniref:Copia protein n=1 Tax=Durusdinium trenchii TaxID=1381693 RepID=A0ABP0RZB4_9DINO
MAIQDQGASSFLIGTEYILRYLAWLQLLGVDLSRLEFKKCSKHFKFGGDASGHARWLLSVPTYINGKAGFIQAYIIFGATPPLLGRPVMEKLQAVVDFGAYKMQILGSDWLPIEKGRQNTMLMRLARKEAGPMQFNNHQFDLRTEDDHHEILRFDDFIEDMKAQSRFSCIKSNLEKTFKPSTAEELLAPEVNIDLEPLQNEHHQVNFHQFLKIKILTNHNNMCHRQWQSQILIRSGSLIHYMLNQPALKKPLKNVEEDLQVDTDLLALDDTMNIHSLNNLVEGETNETCNIYVFMLFTALALFGASQACMKMLKALVNVIGKVMNDEKSQNLMDKENEESHEVETTESSAQTTEQLQKLVPTRLREENERLKNEVKEHIEANAMLQHRINDLEAEVHRQDDRMDEYEVGLREAAQFKPSKAYKANTMSYSKSTAESRTAEKL